MRPVLASCPRLPPPHLQSLPNPPLIPGCGRRVRSCTHHSNSLSTCSPWPNAWSAKIGTIKQTVARQQDSKTARQQVSRHVHVPACIHSNAGMQNNMAGHAVESKQCTAHRSACPCKLLVSFGLVQLRGAPAHNRKSRAQAASLQKVTDRLPQRIVG